jgi:hypothetical protein
VSAPARAVPADARDSATTRALTSGLPLLALLFVAAALISGFTILRRVDPFDEGLMLAAARRIGEGQMPYRDFLWAYGPGQPYLLAGLFDLFGRSLLDWRILRTLADATVAVEAFVLARRLGAAQGPALLAWLAAAGAMAQPTSANPFPYALALGLGALIVLSGDRRGRAPVLWAALLTALAAAWRPDFAGYAALACLATLIARRELRGAALYALATIGLTLLAYLPFLIAAGPHEMWQSLVGRSLREGDYWRLPFPVHYDGPFPLWPPWQLLKRLKDVLDFYVPLLLVISLGAGVALLVLRVRDSWRRLAGLLVFAGGALVYLLSRTDEFHTQPLIVIASILLAALVTRLRAHVALATVPLVLLCLLVLYGATNRLSAAVRPPQLDSLNLAVADGVRVPPDEARALPRVVRVVQQRVPPGQPIYVAPRRSDLVRFNDPLLYFLTDRDNVTNADFALQAGASAQREIVGKLERVRPRVVIRWIDPLSTRCEANRSCVPSGSRLLDQWLGANYRVLETDGHYLLLVPR